MSEFVVHCVGCCECIMCMYGPASVFHPHWGTYSVRVLTYFQCFISVQCVHAKCMSFWFDFHWFSTQLTYMFAMVARCKTVYTCDLYSRGYYLGIFIFCCREHVYKGKQNDEWYVLANNPNYRPIIRISRVSQTKNDLFVWKSRTHNISLIGYDHYDSIQLLLTSARMRVNLRFPTMSSECLNGFPMRFYFVFKDSPTQNQKILRSLRAALIYGPHRCVSSYTHRIVSISFKFIDLIIMSAWRLCLYTRVHHTVLLANDDNLVTCEVRMTPRNVRIHFFLDISSRRFSTYLPTFCHVHNSHKYVHSWLKR